MLKVPEGNAKLKYLKGYGIAIPVTMVLAILGMLLMKAAGFIPSLAFRDFFFSVLMSVLTVLLMNCMVIIGAYMIDWLLAYHTTHQVTNIKRPPVRFVVQYKDHLKLALKVVFFLASWLVLYGSWFGKK
ncbi:hypothetical protein D3C87_270380 [compost metagenome]